ncbi:MAG: DUF2461 domain-containing protein [Devosia sp.]
MTGFPKATLEFLAGIGAHNDKAWFEANRALYEAGYVEAGKAFVSALGPLLREIAPEVKFEPKINGSISRVNRDIRFSKDKRPYKLHLDIWFWLGATKSWDQPGFWFSINAQTVQGGTGMYQFEGEKLDGFRQSAIHPRSGKALVAVMAEVEAKGYAVNGKTRKRPPIGFQIDPERADLLLYEGLYASFELPATEALKPDFTDQLVGRYRDMHPINLWLAEEVVD